MVVDERERRALFTRLEAVLGDDVANTLMNHLLPVGIGELATERSVLQLGDRLRAEMQEQFSGLRSEMYDQIGALRSQMHEHDGGLRSEMHHELNKLRSEMHAGFTQLRSEMHRESIELRRERKTQTLMLFLGIVASNAAFAGIVIGVS